MIYDSLSDQWLINWTFNLPKIRPFISVTALVASSGELKQTKPKPFDRPAGFLGSAGPFSSPSSASSVDGSSTGPSAAFSIWFLNFQKSNRKSLPISYHRHRWWLWHWWLSQKSWTPRAVTRLWLNRPNFWHKGSHLHTIKSVENFKTTLVSLDTLLLQLIILCLQFTLTLCLLLRPSAVNFLQ